MNMKCATWLYLSLILTGAGMAHAEETATALQADLRSEALDRQTAFRVTTTTRLRALPDIHSTITGVISQGRTVELLGSRGGWSEVQVIGGKAKGWMQAKWLMADGGTVQPTAITQQAVANVPTLAATKPQSAVTSAPNPAQATSNQVETGQTATDKTDRERAEAAKLAADKAIAADKAAKAIKYALDMAKSPEYKDKVIMLVLPASLLEDANGKIQVVQPSPRTK